MREPELVACADRYRERVRSASEQDAAEGRLAGDVESLADLAYVMLMGLYVTVKGGAPLEEINRLCGIAIEVVESGGWGEAGFATGDRLRITDSY